MITKRFNDFTSITAKFNSTGTCGHAIAKGDEIGYARGNRRRGVKAETSCSACWTRWCAENAEAYMLEQQASYHQWGACS